MFLKVSFEDAKISKHDYFYCVMEGFFEYHLFEYIIIEYIEDAKISKRDYFYCLMEGWWGFKVEAELVGVISFLGYQDV